MLGVLYAISILWRAYVYWGAPKGGSVAFLGNYWLPANLDVFALGHGARGRAVVGRRPRAARPDPRDDRPARLVVVGRWPRCCFQAVSFWIGLPTAFVLVSGMRAYAKEFLYSFMAFFLILPAVFGRQHTGVTRRFLQLRPMVYLGTISYGIYLWHQAFIEKVHQWGGWSHNPLPNGPFLEMVIPVLAMTIVVASLSWYLVERPLLRRKDRPLFGSSRPARPARASSSSTRRHERDAGDAATQQSLRGIRRLAHGRGACDRRVARHVVHRRGQRPPVPAATSPRLDVGVTIFFVISAFLLYRPFVDAHLHRRGDIALRVFWWRRGLRIFPAYWVALTAAIVLFGITSLHGFWDYSRHYLLVQIYQPKYGLAGIVPTWTLAVELSFYIALPVYAWVLGSITRRQTVPRRVATEIAGAVVLYAFGIAWHWGVVVDTRYERRERALAAGDE